MKVLTACAGLAISAAMALPAAAQQRTTEAQYTQEQTGEAQREAGANGQAMSDQQLSEADAAAEEMVGQYTSWIP
jgi:hypothetical protein